MSDPVRINKYLSEVGYCSRRAADKLIDQGRITVNGEIIGMGVKVTPEDLIYVDGEIIKPKTDKAIYIAFINRNTQFRIYLINISK